LFPQLQDKQVETINLVTNPHQFEINGINFLGTSGQNISDMLLNSTTPKEFDQDDSSRCLHRIQQTLEMRHLCPTAPDTLRIYPFKESDPFILADEANSSLNLEGDTQMEHG
jgi:DNA polymerase delta subunit 2